MASKRTNKKWLLPLTDFAFIMLATVLLDASGNLPLVQAKLTTTSRPNLPASKTLRVTTVYIEGAGKVTTILQISRIP